MLGSATDSDFWSRNVQKGLLCIQHYIFDESDTVNLLLCHLVIIYYGWAVLFVYWACHWSGKCSQWELPKSRQWSIGSLIEHFAYATISNYIILYKSHCLFHRNTQIYCFQGQSTVMQSYWMSFRPGLSDNIHNHTTITHATISYLEWSQSTYSRNVLSTSLFGEGNLQNF